METENKGLPASNLSEKVEMTKTLDRESIKSRRELRRTIVIPALTF
jgi:hypothetical protein